MDESLRIAYLQAMDIPVWVPRDLPPTQNMARELRRGSENHSETHGDSPLGALRGALTPPQNNTKPPVEVAAADSERPDPACQPTRALNWALIRAGDCLIIDEIPVDGGNSGLREFHTAVSKALTLGGDEAKLEEFRWPPQTLRDLEPQAALDAVAGMCEAIRQRGECKRLLILGEETRRVLQRACPDFTANSTVSYHPPGSEMMRSAEAKRSLWVAIAS